MSGCAATWYPGDRVMVSQCGTGTVVEVSNTVPALLVEMDEPDRWHPRVDGRSDRIVVPEQYLTRIEEDRS